MCPPRPKAHHGSCTSSIALSTREILLQNLKNCSEKGNERNYQSYESEVALRVGTTEKTAHREAETGGSGRPDSSSRGSSVEDSHMNLGSYFELEPMERGMHREVSVLESADVSLPPLKFYFSPQSSARLFALRPRRLGQPQAFAGTNTQQRLAAWRIG